MSTCLLCDFFQSTKDNMCYTNGTVHHPLDPACLDFDPLVLPIDEIEHETSCSFDPTLYTDVPLGMFHCPSCGEMVIAGRC